MLFALKIAAIAIGSHGLHNAYEAEAIEIANKGSDLVLAQAADVVAQQFVAHVVGHVGLGIVEQRGHIVLASTASAALIVNEPWCAIFAHHNVSALHVAVEEILAVGLTQIFNECVKVLFQQLLVEGNACQF